MKKDSTVSDLPSVQGKTGSLYFSRFSRGFHLMFPLLRRAHKVMVPFLTVTVHKPQWAKKCSLSISCLMFSKESQLETERSENDMDASKTTDSKIFRDL